jgi:hypothetical protein
MKETNIYSLRLPRSLKLAVERLSSQEGTGINQFGATAVAAKIADLERARLLDDRENTADFRPSPMS